MGTLVLGLMSSLGTAHAQDQQPKQDVPDAPSATRPVQTFPSTPPPVSNSPAPPPNQPAPSAEAPADDSPEAPIPGQESQSTPAPVTQVPRTPGNQPKTASEEELYKISTNVNQVLVPVMVKDDNGRLVGGLLPKDFTVQEVDTKQKLK